MFSEIDNDWPAHKCLSISCSNGFLLIALDHSALTHPVTGTTECLSDWGGQLVSSIGHKPGSDSDVHRKPCLLHPELKPGLMV